MNNLKKKIELLKEYFLQKPEISMAFIFGSYVKGLSTKRSDIDVAVYFKPPSFILEWEEDRDYIDEDKIWIEIENILGIDTDLVILNRAPSHLSSAIITKGTPIIIKDRNIYLDFFLIITGAALDWREFAEDYYNVYSRSRSLSKEDRIRLEKIIIYAEHELMDFPGFFSITQFDYQNNASKRREIERWIENIINASIDIAKVLLASEKKPIPETYEKILSSLNGLGFDYEASKTLGSFTKLRNLLAHEYLDIRFSAIRKFLDKANDVYPKLINFVKGELK